MDEEFCKNVKEKEKETFEEKEIILIPRVRNSIRFFFASFEEKEKKNPGKKRERGGKFERCSKRNRGYLCNKSGNLLCVSEDFFLSFPGLSAIILPSKGGTNVFALLNKCIRFINEKYPLSYSLYCRYRLRSFDIIEIYIYIYSFTPSVLNRSMNRNR